MSKITIIKLVKENASVCSTKIDGGKNWNFKLPNGIPVKVSKKNIMQFMGNKIMGRYYNGDVDGKFWFAVQPSNAHEQFGAEQYEPEPREIPYKIENKPIILNRLIEIENTMGLYLEAAHSFFEQKICYNTEELQLYFKNYGLDCENEGVTRNKISNYADWLLGMELLEYFIKYPDEDTIYLDAEL